MKLSSKQLSAFYETARTGSVTAAARLLHVTQSALSQRLAALESELELTLFIRDAKGLRLTDAGEVLLHHCRVHDGLEQEVLARLTGVDQDLGGVVRVGAFSSVVWSVVVPALGEMVRRYPQLGVEIQAGEMSELLRLLKTGSIDLALVETPPNDHHIEAIKLGEEEVTLIESAVVANTPDTYLDHDVNDDVTQRFLQAQTPPKKIGRRRFLDDIYGIMAAVEQGWGRAAVPRHLFKNNKSVKKVRGYKPIQLPVYLIYYQQPYYPRLHRMLCDALQTSAAEYLS